MSYNTSLINVDAVLNAAPKYFDPAALAVFKYQYENNVLYRQYCTAIHITPDEVKDTRHIPFLPISFFKTHKITTGYIQDDALTFESSGTTGEVPSRHYVRDEQVYRNSLLRGFAQFYGAPEQYAVLALLPSYLERTNASLVHMARVLMEESGHNDNGFYINEWEKLRDTIVRLEAEGQKILLLGVTFALLDFAEAYPMRLQHTLVMETGGMKGRKKEMTRTEVHDVLKQQWKLDNIHAEYGMTELLSQAYSKANGRFACTDTMQAYVRDINDPLTVNTSGYGAINIIDLANIHSCSFIGTEDLGRIHSDGTFEVLGRMDHSALRGCSLMAL